MILAALPLDLVNRNGMVLEAFFIFLLATYLVRETRRRKVSVREWLFRLPPPMNFVLAVMVFDSGVALRSAGLPAIGGLVLIVGSLCKIRALSRPDWGDGPWLLGVAWVMGITLVYFARLGW
jgi:hypothetical protein